jgi:DNA invertase Pin-like site-specific DNA recombinase
MRQAVGYCRVSTGKQERSGLGLEAQQEALARFCKAEGFALTSTYVETESGADDNRPELNKALAEAKRLKCPLMVSKLDRLSRDTHFITGLMKHRTSIVVTELGETVEPFVLQLMAVVAEQERRLVSRRTKDALARAKARGVQLGGYRHDGSTSKAEAMERAEALRPILNELAGKTTRAIAAELNARGIKTAQGKPWTSVQVLRVRARLGRAS